MRVFYVDEAGCTGCLPNATSPIQPIFVLGGIIVEQSKLRDFTLDWLHLKDRFFPKLQIPNSDFLDWMNVEVKGADLRRHIKEVRRDPRRQALGFMDKSLDLLDTNHARLLARLYVKPIGAPFNGRSVYTSAVQSLASDFQQFLNANNSTGLMVLDSRTKPMNANVSHSVFTQKFRAAGDTYAGLIEMPMFGHSDNHAGIQAADLVCSAFLFPMAAYAYCLGHVNNVHVHSQYYRIRDRYGNQLKQMQFRIRMLTNGGGAASRSAMPLAANMADCFLPHENTDTIFWVIEQSPGRSLYSRSRPP